MNLRTLFKRGAKNAGKESEMATETTTATSAAPQTTTPAAGAAAPAGSIDMAAFAALVGAAVADAVKPLNEKIAKLEAPAAAVAAPGGKATDQAKALTAEDIDKLVEKRLAAQQQSAQAQAQRDAFLAEKLKDLPAAYRSKLGGDPAKWKDEEQAIRAEFQKDFAAAGGKPADVGADKPGGAKPAEAVDYSKLSPTQLIAQGCSTSPTRRPSRCARGWCRRSPTSRSSSSGCGSSRSTGSPTSTGGRTRWAAIAFRALNASYTADQGVVNPYIESLAIFGGEVRTDYQIVNKQGDVVRANRSRPR
jgi:hypothetical protein